MQSIWLHSTALAVLHLELCFEYPSEKLLLHGMESESGGFIGFWELVVVTVEGVVGRGIKGSLLSPHHTHIYKHFFYPLCFCVSAVLQHKPHSMLPIIFS